ncbi:MAG: endonuclease/exonuclease/phosphatase family protein [Colwellia sp.]|nr:endonuclease/exonuclease/phosphatase family protein [Colwellia sp.]
MPASSNAKELPQIRVATFNVSMEALNYIDPTKNKPFNITGNELTQALQSDVLKRTLQIRNIAEIIQRINPDIILLNEFDRVENNHDNLRYFISNYLQQSQHNQPSISYPYFYQGAVNTGVLVRSDVNNDGIDSALPTDTHGFGYFEGHYGMVLLSKYPIDNKKIRTFQHFKWHDMPNALQPINPKTQQPWYNNEIWQALRLSSKSHWDIPINVEGETIHILASHPTPPVFDGAENRNGKRNHDEIRFWSDYINDKQGRYIYDDNKKHGALAPHQRFIIIGDQNASTVEGEAIKKGINTLLHDPKIQDPMPISQGGKQHSNKSIYGKYHTASWGMRADYVLPSSLGFSVINSGVFWPTPKENTYRLIKNRQASSDHRLVWVDVKLTK